VEHDGLQENDSKQEETAPYTVPMAIDQNTDSNEVEIYQAGTLCNK